MFGPDKWIWALHFEFFILTVHCFYTNTWVKDLCWNPLSCKEAQHFLEIAPQIWRYVDKIFKSHICVLYRVMRGVSVCVCGRTEKFRKIISVPFDNFIFSER
jgi:hypothetical protein